MIVELYDLLRSLANQISARIGRAEAGSPRMYDSVCDLPADVKPADGGHEWREPWDDPDAASRHGGISFLSGSPLTTWTALSIVEPGEKDYGLRLAPNSPVIVGRGDGLAPEYLDPAYRPTRIVPGTGQTVLHSWGQGPDRRVSRAHFMLRGVSRGIVFVNGVPRKGGGIRPPLFGTRLLAPEGRELGPGEEYLIAAGTTMVVRLPNGTDLCINAS